MLARWETYKDLHTNIRIPKAFFGNQRASHVAEFMVHMIVGSYRDKLEANTGSFEPPTQGIIKRNFLHRVGSMSKSHWAKSFHLDYQFP